MEEFFVFLLVIALVAMVIGALLHKPIIMAHRNNTQKLRKERLRYVKRLIRSRRFKWIGKISEAKPSTKDGYRTIESIDEASVLANYHGGSAMPIYWVATSSPDPVLISSEGRILLDILYDGNYDRLILVDNAIKNAVKFLEEEEDDDDEC